VLRVVRRPYASLPSVRSCHLPTRSVLVVPPDFDGFLRSITAGLSHPAADPGVRPVSDRSLPGLAFEVVAPEGAPFLSARLVGGYHLFPPAPIRRSSRVAQRGRPVFPVASSPFEGFPSLVAVSVASASTRLVCPLGDSSACFHVAPARAFSPLGPMTSPSAPGGSSTLPEGPVSLLLAPWFPPSPAASRPCSTNESVAVAGVSAFACPILPWAWVPLLFLV